MRSSTYFLCFRRLYTFLLLVILCSLQLLAQPVEKITAEFVRTIKKKSSTETTRGTVYLKANGKIHIRVSEPVNQSMVVDNKTMTIYYPLEKKAFRFFSDNPFTLPFYQFFFTINNSDINLAKFGFVLINNQMKKDTLVSSWQQANNSSSGDIIRVALTDDRLAYINVVDKNGTIKSETRYSNYIWKGKHLFPLEILSIQQYNGLQVVEKIVYADPKVNVPFPKEVEEFTIPQNTTTKDIQW